MGERACERKCVMSRAGKQACGRSDAVFLQGETGLRKEFSSVRHEETHSSKEGADFQRGGTL